MTAQELIDALEQQKKDLGGDFPVVIDDCDIDLLEIREVCATEWGVILLANSELPF